MKFYSLSLTADLGVSYGYRFFTSKQEATREAAQWLRDNAGDENRPSAVITAINIEPTKADIMRALNRYASHADNG